MNQSMNSNRDEQNGPGTGTEPVSVPNLPNQVLFWYRFGTDSVPTFNIFGTNSAPVRYRYLPVFILKYRYRTSTKPYRNGYIRYRYPLLRIFGTDTGSVPDGTELIPKFYNLVMSRAPFQL
ncbi:hypothetical protein Hanom_Chr00s123826g01812761 [Helianthus anomalus]